MRLSRGMLFRICQFAHRGKVVILWNSLRKEFKSIGGGDSVAELPAVLGAQYIEIGDGFSCGKDVRLEAWDRYGDQTFSPSIIIGNNVTFTDRCYISCIDQVIVGNGVLLGRDVFISDNSHGDFKAEWLEISPIKRMLTSKGAVCIGNNVWIGRQTTILSGVSVGDNAIIGANSLVNKDIPANSLAVGNPAKIIKRIGDNG